MHAVSLYSTSNNKPLIFQRFPVHRPYKLDVGDRFIQHHRPTSGPSVTESRRRLHAPRRYVFAHVSIDSKRRRLLGLSYDRDANDFILCSEEKMTRIYAFERTILCAEIRPRLTPKDNVSLGRSCYVFGSYVAGITRCIFTLIGQTPHTRRFYL